jgi:hypothetical protein
MRDREQELGFRRLPSRLLAADSIGEMAQLAPVESLTATVGRTLPSLSGPTPEEGAACIRTVFEQRSLQRIGAASFSPA